MTETEVINKALTGFENAGPGVRFAVTRNALDWWAFHGFAPEALRFPKVDVHVRAKVNEDEIARAVKRGESALYFPYATAGYLTEHGAGTSEAEVDTLQSITVGFFAGLLGGGLAQIFPETPSPLADENNANFYLMMRDVVFQKDKASIEREYNRVFAAATTAVGKDGAQKTRFGKEAAALQESINTKTALGVAFVQVGVEEEEKLLEKLREAEGEVLALRANTKISLRATAAARRAFSKSQKIQSENAIAVGVALVAANKAAWSGGTLLALLELMRKARFLPKGFVLE